MFLPAESFRCRFPTVICSLAIHLVVHLPTQCIDPLLSTHRYPQTTNMHVMLFSLDYSKLLSHEAYPAFPTATTHNPCFPTFTNPCALDFSTQSKSHVFGISSYMCPTMYLTRYMPPRYMPPRYMPPPSCRLLLTICYSSTAAQLHSLDHPAGQPLAFVYITESLVVSGAEDASLRLWNTSTGKANSRSKEISLTTDRRTQPAKNSAVHHDLALAWQVNA